MMVPERVPQELGPRGPSHEFGAQLPLSERREARSGRRHRQPI